ncbi:MAG: hypothetical protein KKF41_09810 [Actinobacteria bacterium]|nr:hypothetical protein [Actinomycetota bacterium]MBU1943191.1 hypothetical protein [Actinomycetota bacterium]MBU2687869.1 hypothetical protein [Actinomycetota bacterium]
MSVSRTVLIAAIVVLVVAGVVAAAVFLPGVLSPGTKEFQAADVPFTFEYPSGWRTVTKENRGEFGFDEEDGIPEKYDVLAVASRDGDSVFLLGVGRLPGDKELDQESWDKLKQVARDSTNRKLDELRNEGLQVEGPRIEDESVGSFRAVTIYSTYHKGSAGSADGQVFIDAGRTRYVLDYLHMSTAWNGDGATFDEIVDSLEEKKPEN